MDEAVVDTAVDIALQLANLATQGIMKVLHVVEGGKLTVGQTSVAEVESERRRVGSRLGRGAIVSDLPWHHGVCEGDLQARPRRRS